MDLACRFIPCLFSLAVLTACDGDSGTKASSGSGGLACGVTSGGSGGATFMTGSGGSGGKTSMTGGGFGGATSMNGGGCGGSMVNHGPAGDAVSEALNLRYTRYGGDYPAYTPAAPDHFSPFASMNVFVPGDLLDPSVYAAGATYNNAVTGYHTTPNSGAFLRLDATNLSLDPGEDGADYQPLSPAISTRTAWFVLENPNASSIAYRLYTLNHIDMTNVKTAIAVYRKANNAGCTNVNQLYMDCGGGGLTPVYTRIAFVDNDSQLWFDLADPTNTPSTHPAFVWDPMVNPSGRVPRPLYYTKWTGSTFEVTDWNSWPSDILSWPERVQANISPSPMEGPTHDNLQSSAAYPNHAYIELMNPEPNTTYYVQVLAYPDCGCNSYFTLSMSAELLSSASYSDDGHFVKPVYVKPVATYWNDNLSIPPNAYVGISYDTERPFLALGNGITRVDPGMGVNGYSVWSNTTDTLPPTIGTGTSTLFMPANDATNPLYGATFGSSNRLDDYLYGDNNVRNYSYGLGVVNEETTIPADPAHFRGYNFNYWYNFETGVPGAPITLATYSAHTAYASGAEVTFSNWSFEAPP